MVAAPSQGAGSWAFIIRCRNDEENGWNGWRSPEHQQSHGDDGRHPWPAGSGRALPVRLVADSEYVVKGLGVD